MPRLPRDFFWGKVFIVALRKSFNVVDDGEEESAETVEFSLTTGTNVTLVSPTNVTYTIASDTKAGRWRLQWKACQSAKHLKQQADTRIFSILLQGTHVAAQNHVEMAL